MMHVARIVAIQSNFKNVTPNSVNYCQQTEEQGGTICDVESEGFHS
jgi:hypothetical protein